MILTDEQKSAIESEYNLWKDCQYSGKTKEERQKMSQFFTPPALSIRMAEKFDDVKDKDILDPTAGAGGLLAVMLMCGADPNRVYGIELDPSVAAVCRARLAKLGVPRHHVHVGNALEASSYEFPEPKGKLSITLKKEGAGLIAMFNLSVGEKAKSVQAGIMTKDDVAKVHKLLKQLVAKELEETPEAFKSIATLNRLFAKHGLAEV